MKPGREWALLGLITLAVFLVLALLTARDGRPNLTYLFGVLLLIEIYAIFALGLSLQFGSTGLLNFGHVASMAIGAYTLAILIPLLENAPLSLSTRLVGFQPLGFLLALLLAALMFAATLVATNQAAIRWLPKEQVRFRRWSPLAAASLIGLIVLLLLFPMGPQRAILAVVIVAIGAGALVAALWGLLLGLPAVRLREDYLAIVTIGAAEILRSVIINEEQVTKGTLGFQSIERPVVDWARGAEWWRSLARFLDAQPTVVAHALVGLAILALAYLLVQTLSRSPWGRVLQAIREDEVAASALGKNVNWYKLQSLMIGSALASVAGVLLAWSLSNVYPEHFPNLVTFYGFIMVILGGMGNHRGAIAGAVLLWGVFELAGNITVLGDLGFDNLAGAPQGIAIGLLIVLVIMFRPQGALGKKEEMVHVR
jgi:neutral amino acid transport system permease protein